jgi:hypothetical protein
MPTPVIKLVRPPNRDPFRAEVVRTFASGTLVRVRVLEGEPGWVDPASSRFRRQVGESAAEYQARVDAANVRDVSTRWLHDPT